MRTQLVDGLFADLLQVVRFLRVYYTAKRHKLKKNKSVDILQKLVTTSRNPVGFAWFATAC